MRTPAPPLLGDPSVEVRELTVTYGAVKVLDRLDLAVAPGEFLVLLGPSGCGKSTLLNVVAGLTEASDGEVWIGGRNLTWAEPKERGIGMVFQSYALYPRMSVAENLGFGLKIAGLPKAEIARRVGEAAKLLRLDALLDRRPAELSGGQRQRVAIGRALVRRVDVFLFDEPLSNLDAQLRAELRVEIKRLHQRLGNTMIYVTHDQIEAMTLADRIAVMKNGVIQQLAPPQEIYNRPKNRFVAGFLGSPQMNFLAGRIVADAAERPAVMVGNALLPLSAYAASGPLLEADRSVIVGIRPEHVVADAESPVDGVGRVRFVAPIEMVEPTGADTILWTSLGGRSLTLRVDADRSWDLGDPVAFVVDMSRSSLFDAVGEERL